LKADETLQNEILDKNKVDNPPEI